MILDEIEVIFSQLYHSVQNMIPTEYRILLSLLIFSVLVVAYSIFVWKLYRFIAKKDLITLNLNKYNRSGHPLFNKILAIIFYFVEYIIILPFLIFFWFCVFSLFLFFLAKERPVDQVLLIAGIIIVAIRLTSYYNGSLSKELAKMFPFTLLVLFVTASDFLSVDILLSRIGELLYFANHIIYYLAFIICIEIILRILDLAFSFAGSEEAREEIEKEG